jgi:hypothetical protein
MRWLRKRRQRKQLAFYKAYMSELDRGTGLW